MKNHKQVARSKVSLDQSSFPNIDFELQPALSLDEPQEISGTGPDETKPANLGQAVIVPVANFSDSRRPKTCLEVDFPLLPINALSQLEGNAGKPIYQMSKWWARRRSSVFRAILFAAAMEAPTKKHLNGAPILDSEGIPVPDETEAARAVWEAYYANHQRAGNFRTLKVLDCFMGGGTTLVEGSRLGFQVAGVDLESGGLVRSQKRARLHRPRGGWQFFQTDRGGSQPLYSALLRYRMPAWTYRSMAEEARNRQPRRRRANGCQSGPARPGAGGSQSISLRGPTNYLHLLVETRSLYEAWLRAPNANLPISDNCGQKARR